MIEIDHSLALDDSCQLQFYARGHHEESEFRNAVAANVIAERRAISSEALRRAKVRLIYWRIVPRRNNEVGDNEFVESGKGRGAFPVTLLDAWYPLHDYLPIVRAEA